MKSHTLSSKSWHFWLANFGDHRVWFNEEIDICSYTRKVLVGFLVLLAAAIGIALLLGVFIGLISGTGYWWYEMIVAGGWVEPNPPGALGTVFVLMYGYAHLHQYIQRRLKERKPSPSGFVNLVSTKLKSKTCFMINFDSKDSK